MNPSQIYRFLLPLIALALLHPLAGQDFDYGDAELSPTELYDEALKHLYGGDGYKINRNAAISKLKKAAEKGYATAHNTLGSLHLQGNGLFTSPRKALRSFEDAAALNDPLGHYNAGYSYLVGRGAQANMATAERHFLAVVDESTQRNLSPEEFGTFRNARAAAYFYLGIIYSDEDDKTYFDAKKATDCFHKSDELNEPNAAMLLAIRYARGEGAEQDQAKSEAFLERYKIAALNKLHNSISQVLFQGMDREDVKASLDEIISSYADQMSEQIQSMQTAFGVSLLDEEELYSPEQAFAWLKPVATEENHLASSRLATLYYRGEGTEPNLEKARELLEHASKQEAMAKYNLAVMLAKGEGGDANLVRAKDLFEKAAKSSWYPAIHYKSPETAPFITERDAIALVKQQAEQRDPDALFCLGRRTLWGLGVERNYDSAKAMILAASELGNAQARFYYGVYIASDFSWLGPSEEDKAIQAAAEAGYPPAIHELGVKAESSNRYKVALENYERSASLGHIPSLYKLGYYYLEGRGVAVDYQKAVSYFQKAADTEDPIGMLNLGLAYEYGFGVEQDLSRAYDLYKEARLRGSYYAEYAIGNLLASGKIGEAAWEEAIPYWESAGAYRNKDAYLRLSECHRTGKGVKKNLSLAFNYYNRAYALTYYGDNDTQYELVQFKLDPKSELYNPGQAVNMLRMLELSGYPLAGYKLAELNRDGIGLRQNAKKAYNKYLKTAELLGTELKVQLDSEFDSFFSKETNLDKGVRPVDRETEILHEAALDACYQIAFILKSGQIKKTSPQDCAIWYQTAARLGHAPSKLALGKLYLSGQYVDQDEPFGWKLVQEAAATDAEAKFFAAKSFFDGKFPDLGREAAISLLRSAVASGLEKAQHTLEKHEIPIEAENEQDTAPVPARKGEDDGFDGPVDLDLA
ncbi:hypothetical protein QEH56_20110 [Pelagicoccus enzymogenes]|uniref:tetratricopeptide repeat protein n=1 Tax=Pelagicoccus enzymogenes TaxID=2773457 RepID=UPI00281011C9|nr:hypothetical protein [Pelagicoccus enzymogenes]MDQ8200481.1 hypothetical protein [Pelagicoccus enzymogenes]